MNIPICEICGDLVVLCGHPQSDENFNGGVDLELTIHTDFPYHDAPPDIEESDDAE